MKSLRLSLIATGAALALLRWFDLHPVTLSPLPEPVAGARPLTTRVASPVLVVVDDERVRLSAEQVSFAALDCSYQWANIVQTVVGPVTLVQAEAASPEALRPHSVIIVTRSAMHSDRLRSILSRVSHARLLFDLPTDGWVSVTGVRLEPSTHELRPLPTVRGARAPTPVLVGVHGLTDSSADARAALETADGRPLVVQRGNAFSTTCDFARWMTIWKQGQPNDDFSTPKRFADRTGVDPPQTTDLMAEGLPLKQYAPAADDLCRRLLWCVAPELPRWQAAPDRAPAMFAMTQDEEGYGDRSRFMTRYQAQHGWTSTMFVTPAAVSADGVRAMVDDGADIQFHWNRGFQETLWETIGWWRIQPFRRPLSLAGQRDMLAAKLPPGKKLRGNRNHGLLWGDHATRRWGELAAAGFEYDSSFGPTGQGLFGFVFGTASPYRPLDASGFPAPLWEAPFVCQDDEEFSRQEFDRLLRAAAGGPGGVVIPIFHTTTMGWKPSVQVFDAWMESYAEARGMGYWLCSLSDAIDFWQARVDSAVRIVESGHVFEVDARMDDMTLAIPLRDSAPLDWFGTVTIDGSPVRIRIQEEALSAESKKWQRLLLVPVPRGSHRVVVS